MQRKDNSNMLGQVYLLIQQPFMDHLIKHATLSLLKKGMVHVCKKIAFRPT